MCWLCIPDRREKRRKTKTLKKWFALFFFLFLKDFKHVQRLMKMKEWQCMQSASNAAHPQPPFSRMKERDGGCNERTTESKHWITEVFFITAYSRLNRKVSKSLSYKPQSALGINLYEENAQCKMNSSTQIDIKDERCMTIESLYNHKAALLLYCTFI